MDPVSQASDLLAGVEVALRRLIENCLSTESYGAIAELARLAEGVSQLRRSVNGRSDRSPLEFNGKEVTVGPSPAPPEPNGARRVTVKPTAQAQEYPRFQREADKLIKIGWSDREKQSYEHRAPKAAVLRVCDEISRRSLRAKRFRMEDVLSELASGRDALPTYQAYLTLAWLRSLRVVDRDGKDGYRVKDGQLSQDRVHDLWESAEERA